MGPCPVAHWVLWIFFLHGIKKKFPFPKQSLQYTHQTNKNKNVLHTFIIHKANLLTVFSFSENKSCFLHKLYMIFFNRCRKSWPKNAMTARITYVCNVIICSLAIKKSKLYIKFAVLVFNIPDLEMSLNKRTSQKADPAKSFRCSF